MLQQGGNLSLAGGLIPHSCYSHFARLDVISGSVPEFRSPLGQVTAPRLSLIPAHEVLRLQCGGAAAVCNA